MPEQRSLARPEPGTPAHEDRVFQVAVFLAALDSIPVQVTVSELIREIAIDPDDFATRDGIERAVQDLAGIGLLHRHDFRNRPDTLVMPTRAALRAYVLLEDDEPTRAV